MLMTGTAANVQRVGRHAMKGMIGARTVRSAPGAVRQERKNMTGIA
jgi:hypothetical protein